MYNHGATIWRRARRNPAPVARETNTRDSGRIPDGENPATARGAPAPKKRNTHQLRKIVPFCVSRCCCLFSDVGCRRLRKTVILRWRFFCGSKKPERTVGVCGVFYNGGRIRADQSRMGFLHCRREPAMGQPSAFPASNPTLRLAMADGRLFEAHGCRPVLRRRLRRRNGSERSERPSALTVSVASIFPVWSATSDSEGGTTRAPRAIAKVARSVR